METPSLSFGADGAADALQAVASGAHRQHATPALNAYPLAAAYEAATATRDAAEAAAAGGTAGSESARGRMHSSGGVARPRFSAASLKARSGPLFCQVEGCGTPLEGLKEYHQRYKVCEEHLKTPYIIRDGQQVRFCQQCGRFQPLADFDDNKRSCRVRLQKHNARRRKRPREDAAGGGAAAGSPGDLAEYGQAAAEMARLAAQQFAAATGAPPPGAVAITAKEVQAMQDALQFASTTLAYSNQAAADEPAGEEGAEEGEAGTAGAGSMPFVPAPDVMMLLLKGYAAMFHYVLDSATIRALAPPSELPPDAGAAAGAAGALDPLQLQQLLQAQSMLGAAAGGLPVMLGGADVAGILAAAGAQGMTEDDIAGALAEAAAAAGLEDEAPEVAAGEPGVLEAEQQQQQQQQEGEPAASEGERALADAAGVAEPAAGYEQEAAATSGGGLTAEQAASALAPTLPAHAAAAAVVAAGAAASAEALAAAAAGSAGYYGNLEAAPAGLGVGAGTAAAVGAHGEAPPE